MLEQHARVIESSEAGVWVEPVEPSGCGVCAGQGCASRQIAELFQRYPRRYQVESHFDVSAGDRVVIGMPEGSVVRSALSLYGLPLLFILAGALLAQAWSPGDAIAVLGAVLGGLVAWGLTGFNLVGRDTRYRPVVMRREAMIMVNTSKGISR